MNNNIGNRKQLIGNVVRAGIFGAVLTVFPASTATFAQEAVQKTFVTPEQQKPNEALTLVGKGKELLAAKQYQEALEAFQKAAELEPATDAAWDGQSDALHALKRPADANALLDKWVQVQPRNLNAWTYKMMMNAMAGHHADALKACDKLIELDPANGDYNMGRGQMLTCLGRDDEALAAYEKAAALSTNLIVRADAWNGCAEMLARKGKFDEVIKSCTKSIELSGRNPQPWYRRAVARAQAADTANALADLKKAIELRPEYKGEAAKDAAFKALQDNAGFKTLTK